MKRWVKVLIIVAASLLVLGGVAEWGLRLFVPGIIQQEVRKSLNLPKSHPVDVELGGSALLNAIGGGLGDVSVEVPDAPVVEGLTATLAFHADRVPFAATSQAMSDATASIFVPAGELDPVVSLLTNGVATSGTTSGGELVVGRSLEVFGFSVPITARLALSAEDGRVRIEPRGLAAVGFDLSAEQLASATGRLLDPLLSPQLVCVSDKIPAGVTIESIDVAMNGVRVGVRLAPTLLADAAQRQPGTC